MTSRDIKFPAFEVNYILISLAYNRLKSIVHRRRTREAFSCVMSKLNTGRREKKATQNVILMSMLELF